MPRPLGKPSKMTSGAPGGPLPGLRRGLPLLFLGVLVFGSGAYFWFADRSAILGAYPAWLYCLPVGAVALIGGLATSFFPEGPEPVRAGSPVAEGFVAVPTDDWLAIQRLLRPAAARAGGAGTMASTGATAGSAGSPGAPSKDLVATSFAFAPALANDSSAARRKRAGLPVRREDLTGVEGTEAAAGSSTASTGP